MSLLTGHTMMRPISIEELNLNINSPNHAKAEGLDGVTNEMIRNTGAQACLQLLKMFNNVLVGSQPSDWKLGDVVLILKKPPATDVGN